MRLRLLTVTSLAVAALALTGCPKKNGECDATEDCKGQDGFAADVCVDHKCQECGSDKDCKDGFVCQANRCVPKPECSGDADCGAGKSCKAGKCALAGCAKPSDCPSGKCFDGACAAPNACKSQKDCTGKATCLAGTCQEPAVAEQCQLKRVSFGFNEATLDGSGQDVLKSDADCIQQRKLAVTLEGNADERGTDEYNLHLGERRANSVKTYLEKLGVAAGKLKTISYGKERPANPGHDEAAWAENRRVELVEKP
jgi:peptidoglycan-associated lipoprotein